MVDEMIIVYACKVKLFPMNLFIKTIRLFVNNETQQKYQRRRRVFARFPRSILLFSS